MRELKKIYRTTLRDVESQAVIDALFIPKALLPDEVREDPFKALRATARAIGLPLQEPEPMGYGKNEFSNVELGNALNISPDLADELFNRDDIIVGEMSKAKMTAIAQLVASGVAVGTLAATTGPIVLLYCGAGIIIVGAGVLIIGGALKWLGY